MDAVKEYINSFDTDEHIEMWVKARGEGANGVPSIRTLVSDADDIAELLAELDTVLRVSVEALYGYVPVHAQNERTTDIYEFIDWMQDEYSPLDEEQDIKISVGGKELVLPFSENNLLIIQDALDYAEHRMHLGEQDF